MTVSRFYPYATVANGIVLQIDAADPQPFLTDDGSVWAADEDVSEVGLTLRVSLEESVLGKVLPTSESDGSTAHLVLVAQTTQGRRREAFQVGSDGLVSLSLARSEWVGVVELYGLLVRSHESTEPLEGFASHRHALLAWSEPLQVRFDEAPDRPGDLLPVRWVRFTERPDLRDCRQHLFAVIPENPPELLLNLDVLELRAVLDSKGTHGTKARIRDAIFMQIAHQVWTSLLVTALSSLATEASAVTTGLGQDVLDQLSPWEAAVLRRWGPDLLPEVEEESIISDLADAVSGSRAGHLFLFRIPNAVQRRLESYRPFEGLVKDTGLRSALEGQ